MPKNQVDRISSILPAPEPQKIFAFYGLEQVLTCAEFIHLVDSQSNRLCCLNGEAILSRELRVKNLRLAKIRKPSPFKIQRSLRQNKGLTLWVLEILRIKLSRGPGGRWSYEEEACYQNIVQESGSGYARASRANYNEVQDSLPCPVHPFPDIFFHGFPWLYGLASDRLGQLLRVGCLFEPGSRPGCFVANRSERLVGLERTLNFLTSF